MKKLTIILILVISFFVGIGCLGEPASRIKKKLDIILDDDLIAITEDMVPSNLLDSIYYDIRIYQEYNEGKYSRRAEVDFYFLKDINAKIVRKYRYHRDFKKWDRYFNEYRFTEK